MEKEQLRVKHFPQIPCKAFEVEVESVQEAVKIMDVLAEYDLFQYKNRIKPDYSNMTVLEKYCDDCEDWIVWDIELKDDVGELYEYFDNPKDYVEWLSK